MRFKFGLGGFPDFVVTGYSFESELLLSEVPSLEELMNLERSQLAEQLSELDEFNFVVFRLSGENPMEFIQLLRIQGLLRLFQDRKYVVAFWTMDSHHLGTHEMRAQKYFDHVFLAHEAYSHLFSKESSSILPCSFSLAPESVVRQVIASTQPLHPIGVSAPFAPYPWQGRNHKYFLGFKAAEELKLPNFFGAVRGGANYPNEALIRTLMSYKAVLNVSLSDDLNMRNFEALALNRVLISNRLKSHSFLKPWEDNIIFVDNDFSNIKAKLIESQSISPRDFSEGFLYQHSIRARLEQIVETLTGQRISLRDHDAKQGVEYSGAAGLAASVGTKGGKHSPIFLLARAKWPTYNSLISAITLSPPKKNLALNFFRLWLIAAGIKTLATIYGRSSTLRAIHRLSRRTAQSGVTVGD